MKAVVRVGGRWAVSWLCVGIVVGLILMVQKAPPIAESGHKPDEMSWYSFWVPLMAILGALFGLVTGLIYGGLMIAARPLRGKAGAATWAARNLPRLACGFIAAAAVVAWSGPEGAVMFGMLGLVSASVSRFDTR